MKSRAVREAPATYARLQAAHADAHCELDHAGAFQLIVATVLSAQATDVSVNRVTPALFRKWPTPQRLSQADCSEVEQALSSIGMFRQKAKNVTRLAQRLVSDHDAEVPRTLAELVKLPGVGRKTANVVLGVAFARAEGVVVDTHVQRIAQRLGWTRQTMPEPIERDLMRLFPQREWPQLSHVLIFHGRRICTARSPACAGCPVAEGCPSAFDAERVGRKAPRPRSGIRAEARELAAPRRAAAKKRSTKKKRAAKKAKAAPRVSASERAKSGAKTSRRA